MSLAYDWIYDFVGNMDEMETEQLEMLADSLKEVLDLVQIKLARRN